MCLDIDFECIMWRCVVDMNDCFLREIIVGESSTEKGKIRKIGFDIIVVLEIMVVLVMMILFVDMENCFGNMVVGFVCDGILVMCDDLGVIGALMVFMRDVIKLMLM